MSGHPVDSEVQGTNDSISCEPLLFIIFVRLGVNPSALLECLHLVALDVRVSLRDSLVTLGGCRHLDRLEQRGSSSGGW